MKKLKKNTLFVGIVIAAGLAPNFAFANDQTVPAPAAPAPTVCETAGDPQCDPFIPLPKDFAANSFISDQEMSHILAVDGEKPGAKVGDDSAGKGLVSLTGKVFSNCSQFFSITTTQQSDNPVLTEEGSDFKPTESIKDSDGKDSKVLEVGFTLTDPHGWGRECMAAHHAAKDICSDALPCVKLANFSKVSIDLSKVDQRAVIGLAGSNPSADPSYVFTPFKGDVDGKILHVPSSEYVAAQAAAAKAARDKQADDAAAAHQKWLDKEIARAQNQLKMCHNPDTIQAAADFLTNNGITVTMDVDKALEKAKKDQEAKELQAKFDKLNDLYKDMAKIGDKDDKDGNNKTALNDLNEEVLQLADTYPELASCTEARKSHHSQCIGDLIHRIGDKFEKMKDASDARTVYASGEHVPGIDKATEQFFEDSQPRLRSAELKNESAKIAKEIKSLQTKGGNASSVDDVTSEYTTYQDNYTSYLSDMQDAAQNDCDSTSDDYSVNKCQSDVLALKAAVASNNTAAQAYAGLQQQEQMQTMQTMYGGNGTNAMMAMNGQQYYGPYSAQTMSLYGSNPMLMQQQMPMNYGMPMYQPSYYPQQGYYGGQSMMMPGMGNVGAF